MKRRDFLKATGMSTASIVAAPLLSVSAEPKVETLVNASKEKPNVLWIFLEDITPIMSCYGVKNNPTPNIDKLAENGVLFSRAFSPAPVCSPARSGVITGMMPSTINAHQHHSSRTVESGIFLPEGVKTVPEIFQDAGYHTFNLGKDDYNFIYNRAKVYTGEYETHFWYTFEGSKGTWKERKPGQPFFGQMNLVAGKWNLNKKYVDEHLPVSRRVDRSVVEMPPIYPDIPELREILAQHYDCNRMVDDKVAEILNDLKKDGVLDNTIVFLFSDHGWEGGMRHKQFCYDGGLQSPLVIADFRKSNKIPKNKVREDLVSTIDVAATSLALAGIKIPKKMEAKDLFAKDYKEQEYIISGRDRCDFTVDHVRTVRTKKFRYIKNFMTDKPYMQPNYRDNRTEMIAVRKWAKEGKMNKEQAWFYADFRPEEELYDLEKDPHEMKNVANLPEYKSELERLRNILNDWIKKTDDKGQYPEGATTAGMEGLRFIMLKWGADRCTAKEFDFVKKHPMPGTPPVDIRKKGSEV